MLGEPQSKVSARDRRVGDGEIGPRVGAHHLILKVELERLHGARGIPRLESNVGNRRSIVELYRGAGEFTLMREVT